MILSIDFRTDIPAFYSEWLMNRFREGYVYFRNPAVPNTIHKIILDRNYRNTDEIVQESSSFLGNKMRALGYKRTVIFII